MEFEKTISQFSERIEALKDSIRTEEATKTSLIMPFFQLLGYDVFNPLEFTPEFIADVGTKKGEKVDYAIIVNDKPVILVECKSCNKNLDKHSSQLFRYFSATVSKFAILTNGIKYNFYTDLDEPNKMDLTPFLEIDLLNISPEQINELRNFHKINFNVETVFNSASQLKYHKAIKAAINEIYTNPSDEFIRLVLSDVYHGVKTQNVISRFKDIVQKSFSEFISELVNANIASSISSQTQTLPSTTPTISTDSEEIEAFYIVRNILGETLPRDSISYKVTESYLSVLYNNSPRKWICRLVLGTEKKQILLPDGKNFKRIYIKNVQEIYDYSDLLLQSASKFSDNNNTTSTTITTSQTRKKADSVTMEETLFKDSSRGLDMSRGQKTKLKTLCDDTEIFIKIDIPKVNSCDIDLSCFAVDGNNKLFDDQYFIFYNQTESENGAIKLLESANSVSNIFKLSLNLLPKEIEKIVFTASIDGEFCMNELKDSSMSIANTSTNLAIYSFNGNDFEKQKAIILCEIYRKENDWTISVISQGFNGGLEALLNHFGGEAL